MNEISNAHQETTRGDDEATAATIDEDYNQLHPYLVKFIELVPGLKEIDRIEKIETILQHTNTNSGSIGQQLESFQNLDLNEGGSGGDTVTRTTTLSDLQILQSVLDYIRDLKSKVDL